MVQPYKVPVIDNTAVKTFERFELEMERHHVD